ncbi:stage III sporulation protein AG [Bacillus carboniphilus]|uniref:Stage III sporulation protein AG n=1 Tax=Bacillus carboniphilus TaxID=86663 RepID=A0ABN0WT50_9BACI
MNNDKGPLTWIKKWLQKLESSSDREEAKKPSKYQYLLIVLLAGVAIMLVSNVLTAESKPEGQSTLTFSNGKESDSTEDVETLGQQKDSGKQVTMSDFERMYETQIKDALDQIVGVSDVTVVVNVASTAANVYETNRVTQKQTTDETDRQGGKRTVEDSSVDEQIVIIRDGQKEVPLLYKTEKPAVKGVLVVARGAENIQVKQWIIEAVTRVLDVPIHRVAVMPKKSKGDS